MHIAHQNKKVRDVVRASVLRSKNAKDLKSEIEILENQRMFPVTSVRH